MNTTTERRKTMGTYLIETSVAGKRWWPMTRFQATTMLEALEVFEGEVNREPLKARRLLMEMDGWSKMAIVLREHVEEETGN
jgi:hypothetical protein